MKRSNRGYSLVELLITVAATAILFAAIAVPSLNVLRGSKLSGCRNNIAVIEAAKTSWSSDHPAALYHIQQGGGTQPTLTEIEEYFPEKVIPTCPDRGTYSGVLLIGTDVTCSANGH